MAAVSVENLELGRAGRITDGQAHHEPVELRLGQWIGPFVLEWILRRDHHEGLVEQMSVPVDGHLSLLHAFEQRGLGLRGRAVDLVSEADVGEYCPRLELELAPALIPDGYAGNVGRKEVRSELDTLPRAVDRPRQRLGEHGLAHARHVL